MSESLTSKTTEFSAGVTGAIPLHSDSATGYLYPLVQLVPTELGGLTKHSLVCAATDNATLVKAAAGQFYGYSIFNIDANPVYLKLYDKATAPTVGTDTPYLRFGCPKAATAADGAFASGFWPIGIAFSTGIGFGVVGGSAATGILDAATTALTASKVLVNLYYK